jgi:hypothetical protein
LLLCSSLFLRSLPCWIWQATGSGGRSHPVFLALPSASDQFERIRLKRTDTCDAPQRFLHHSRSHRPLADDKKNSLITTVTATI